MSRLILVRCRQCGEILTVNIETGRKIGWPLHCGVPMRPQGRRK